MKAIFLQFLFLLTLITVSSAQPDNISVAGCSDTNYNGDYVLSGSSSNGCNCYEKGGGTEIMSLIDLSGSFAWFGSNSCGGSTFQMTANDASDCNPTAYLGVNGCSFGVLPVELVSFDLMSGKKSIVLNWKTASELNNKGFQIEHSTNGTYWTILHFTEGAGTTLEPKFYSYTHETPVSGVNYYRLKQIDFDGAFEYSKTIISYFGSEASGMYFAPNPTTVTGGNLRLEVTAEKFNTGELTIYDINGKMISDRTVDSQNTMIALPDLSPGIYYAKLVFGQKSITAKLSVE